MFSLDEYIIFLDRKVTTKLSLAVALKDEFTGKQPFGHVSVFIRDQKLKSIKNRKGYFIFLNLPDSKFKVLTESEYYFKVETTVDASELDPLNPVVSITLKPKPSYPFPSGATLIRGMVQDNHGNSIPGAKVEVRGHKISNKTTIKGEFVIYFKSLTEDDIIVEDRKRYVKGNSEKKIHLKATHASKSGTAYLEKIEEGMATPLGSPIILD